MDFKIDHIGISDYNKRLCDQQQKTSIIQNFVMSDGIETVWTHFKNVMDNETYLVKDMDIGATNIIRIQAIIITMVAWAYYALQGKFAAQAALFGGCVAIFNVWITNRRMRKAAYIAEVAPGKEIGVFYTTAIYRFLYTLAFFIIGMKALALEPLPLIISFALAQVAYFIHGQMKKSS